MKLRRQGTGRSLTRTPPQGQAQQRSILVEHVRTPSMLDGKSRKTSQRKLFLQHQWVLRGDKKLARQTGEDKGTLHILGCREVCVTLNELSSLAWASAWLTLVLGCGWGIWNAECLGLGWYGCLGGLARTPANFNFWNQCGEMSGSYSSQPVCHGNLACMPVPGSVVWSNKPLSYHFHKCSVYSRILFNRFQMRIY